MGVEVSFAGSLTGFFLWMWNVISPFWALGKLKAKRTVEFIAETNLPTLTGKFRVRAYRTTDASKVSMEPVAVIMGDVDGVENLPIRVHDQCFTSEVIGSTKCDCREQLEWSLDFIRNNRPGIVIYLQQEGRGIGLANKIAAYSLQERGYDTVEANRKLGLPDDTRSYETVVDILRDLKVKSIQLITNNPRKIDSLQKLGIQITGRIPIHIPPNGDNVLYLRAKAQKMNHLISENFLEVSTS